MTSSTRRAFTHARMRALRIVVRDALREKGVDPFTATRYEVTAHAGDSGVSSYSGDIPVENAAGRNLPGQIELQPEVNQDIWPLAPGQGGNGGKDNAHNH